MSIYANDDGQYAMWALGQMVAERLLGSRAYTSKHELEVDADVYINKAGFFPGETNLDDLFWMGLDRAFSNHNNQEV